MPTQEQPIHEYLLPALTQLLRGAKVRWMNKNPLIVTDVDYDTETNIFYVNTFCLKTGQKDRISLTSFSGSRLLEDLDYEVLGGSDHRVENDSQPPLRHVQTPPKSTEQSRQPDSCSGGYDFADNELREPIDM